MKCVLCGEPWPLDTLPFSAVCPGCGCWLHSCKQCSLWEGSSARCRSMTTDPVADRESKNFCEEWTKLPDTSDEPSQQNRKKESIDKFNSLFGD